MSSFTTPKTQIFEGILYKQGQYNKAWKQRFFVLYSDRTLAYFKDEQAWDKNKSQISFIDLQQVRSIAQINLKPPDSKAQSIERAKKKEKKKRKRSLSRKWSIDFSAIFSNKTGADEEEEESDNDNDGEIAFIELVLDKVFAFEIVQAKRTYVLCIDDANKYNKWMQRLEIVTFGKKLYKGWMLKQSNQNKKWDKRWFIIYDTQEMRYYDDPSRAVSRGMAVLTQLKKITKMDDEKAKKKYKQSNVLKLEFKQRTLLLSCSPSDDRRIWFDKICRAVGENAHFVDAIYDDYLYRYDNKAGKWKKRWFLLDEKGLYQFKDMEQCDEFCRYGFIEESQYKKAFKRYVEDYVLLQPFDSKNVQKIRPGSNLQKKLIKECIFILHSKKLGKLFFATEQQNQLNRWFKKIRSLAGDNGVRKKSRQLSKSHVSSMAGSEGNETKVDDADPASLISTKASKGQSKILAMLQEIERDFRDCKEDISYIKTQWEENNESSDGSDDDEY